MTPRRRRGPSTPFFVALALLLLLLVAGGALAWLLHDRDRTASPGTAASTTTGVATDTGTTTTPASNRLVVYFLRDGAMGAAGRRVDATPAVGKAALAALLAGPTPDEEADGLNTAIPPGTTLASLAIANGRATVKLSTALSELARAQVVFTLTQFPTVNDVVVETPAGASKPLSRKRLEGLSPIILVETPTPGDTVTSPLRVAGTSNTFEATLQLELTDADGTVLAKRFLTATSGTGTRGTFSGTLTFSQQPSGTGLVLTAYEDSAENGQRIHVVQIPLVAG
jgi:germination protein M